MTNEEAESCIQTIEMLRKWKLKNNQLGVMNVIDADNCEKIIKVLSDIPKYKDAYNKGYEAGVNAVEICRDIAWEERIDAIKADIDKQYKWLMQTKHTLYDIDIAFSGIKSFIDKHIGGGE